MVSLVEALDTSCRIDELLRTREERMACRADFDMEVLGRGLGRDHIATGAMDFLESVLRMDILLHFVSSGSMYLTICFHRRAISPLPRSRWSIHRVEELLIIVCLLHLVNQSHGHVDIVEIAES